MRQWAGAGRFLYNKTLEHLKQPDTKANWIALKGNAIRSAPEWAKDVPYQIKSIAIKDACKNVGRAKLKYKNGGGFNEVKFRTRKGRQSIYIPHSAVKDGSIYVRYLGQMKSAKPICSAKYDCRVLYEYGRWWLCMPEKKTVEHPIAKDSIVALDPGIRTFQTLYSPSGVCEIGNKSIERIARLCNHLDAMLSKATEARAKNKRRILKACERMRFRIKCLKDELHYKTSRFVVDNFNIIVIPTFSTSDFVVKSKRKLRKKTVKALLNLGHGSFKTILKRMAAESGRHVVEISEAYTSKTCPSCGHLHSKLGGNKVFRCPSCGLTISRDINGARNILLRALVDQPTV